MRVEILAYTQKNLLNNGNKDNWYQSLRKRHVFTNRVGTIPDGHTVLSGEIPPSVSGHVDEVTAGTGSRIPTRDMLNKRGPATVTEPPSSSRCSAGRDPAAADLVASTSSGTVKPSSGTIYL